MSRLHLFLRAVCFVSIVGVGILLPVNIYAHGFATYLPSSQPATHLLIHQVRGGECCSPGSVAAVEQQIRAVEANQLQGYFALRYDALTDPRYTQVLKQHQAKEGATIVPAALVEITPKLAKAAGVVYQGDSEKWYQAQQAYTIGYSQEDRRKLIDTLMKTFYQTFGSYPVLTSAWMIDTPSLNYLHDEYGVQVHQITREQWGLDSYTLYGGPFHYPYLASRNWLLMPESQQELNQQAVLIVRQTVMDPLWVYGDTTSAFTSQPNDYALDGKQFGYFERLLDQTVSQPTQAGFLLLGLENSMADEHQQAYRQQLNWLGKQQQLQRVTSASITALRTQYQNAWPQVVVGADVAGGQPATSYWITGENYRVRLLLKAGQWWLSDLRLYDQRVQDPYAEQIAQQNGYWVAPFIVDASLTHGRGSNRSWIQQLLLPPEVHSSKAQAKNDVDLEVLNAVALPAMPERVAPVLERTAQGVEIEYSTPEGKQIRWQFGARSVTTSGWDPVPAWNKLQFDQQYPLQVTQQGNETRIAWQVGNEPSHAVVLSKQGETTEWHFVVQPELWAKLRQQFYFYFFPESQLVHTPDAKRTVLYVHNRYALAKRNPVRIVLAPRDGDNRPVGLNQPVEVTAVAGNVRQQQAGLAQPAISDTVKKHHEDLQFVDVYQAEPAAVQVTLQLGDWTTHEKVYFAPDCKAQWRTCVRHPFQAYWFMRVKFDEWLKAKLEK